MSWRRGGAQLREARRSVAQTSGARTRRLPKGSPDNQGSSGIRTAIRNFKFGGNMVKASRSFGALPFSVATSTNSKLRASVATVSYTHLTLPSFVRRAGVMPRAGLRQLTKSTSPHRLVAG